VLTACLLLAIPLLWAGYRALRRRTRVLTTALPCYLAVTALLLLPAPTASSRLLQPVTTPPTLAIHFPHEKHTTVNCVACHHNFLDKTGIGSCLDCHRSANTALTQSAEATFHIFCRNCHSQIAQTTTGRHGPTRACSACHAR
jgi:predicted CXXCH cytochrome family protein